jgi:hypothetical protein
MNEWIVSFHHHSLPLFEAGRRNCGGAKITRTQERGSIAWRTGREGSHARGGEARGARGARATLMRQQVLASQPGAQTSSTDLSGAAAERSKSQPPRGTSTSSSS